MSRVNPSLSYILSNSARAARPRATERKPANLKALEIKQQANLLIERINRQHGTSIQEISEDIALRLFRLGIQASDFEQPDIAGFERLIFFREEIEGVRAFEAMLEEGLISQSDLPIIKMVLMKLIVDAPLNPADPLMPFMWDLGFVSSDVAFRFSEHKEYLSSGKFSLKDFPLMLEVAESHGQELDFYFSVVFDWVSNRRILDRVKEIMDNKDLTLHQICMWTGDYIDNEEILDLIEESAWICSYRNYDVLAALQYFIASNILSNEGLVAITPFMDRLIDLRMFDFEGKFEEYLAHLGTRSFIPQSIEHSVIERSIPALERIIAAGYFPSRELIAVLERDPHKTLPPLSTVKETIEAGGFNPKDPLHISAGFILLNERVDENPLIKNPPKYKDYRLMLRRYLSPTNSETTQIVSSKQAELVCLAYEAHRFKEFIIEILESAQKMGRQVLVAQNLSYGAIALAPIRKDLGRLGIKITSARIGSTVCHDNPDYTRKDLFDERTVDYIKRERPIVIIVDGSNSVSGKGRIPHIPDAYQGYQNFPVFKEHYPSFEFWYPGKKKLWLRVKREPISQAEPIDPKKVTKPIVIFAQTAIEHEAIPQEIREKAGIQHEAAAFDDKEDFVEAAFDLSSSGPVFSNVIMRAARETYKELFASGQKETSPAKEISSLKQLGLSFFQQQKAIESLRHMKFYIEQGIPAFGLGSICAILQMSFGVKAQYEDIHVKYAEKVIDRKSFVSVFYSIIKEKVGLEIDFSKLAEIPRDLRIFFTP